MIRWPIPEEARDHCGIELVSLKEMKDVDAVILAVAHRKYQEMGLNRIISLCRKDCRILLDIKAVFEPETARAAGITIGACNPRVQRRPQ